MKKSTIEKLKQLVMGGEITEETLQFMEMIMDDNECPIVLETNPEILMNEVERYKFQSIKTNTVIAKEVIPIYGKIDYFVKTINYNDFVETKMIPSQVQDSSIVYIEEYKLECKNNGILKTILDKKVLVFLDYDNIKDQIRKDPLKCCIIA